MPREPNWTNDTTRRVAHAILKLCQPAASKGDAEPVDWEQVLTFLGAQRDAAIRKLEKRRKAK
jgi:hypothetical protein